MTKKYNIKTENDFKTFKKYVSSTDTFKEVGRALPIRFYNDADGYHICPIIQSGTTITGVFPTGLKLAAREFTTHLKEKGKVPLLEDGVYLYDFKNGKVIYDYTQNKFYDENVWTRLPKPFNETEFDHVIGVDKSGHAHKVWHKTGSFTEVCYLGYLFNTHFCKDNSYKLRVAGTNVAFHYLARLYNLRVPNARHLKSFMENSFEPKGFKNPDYTLSATFLDLVFDPNVIELPSLLSEQNYDPFCGYPLVGQQSYWEELDHEPLSVMDLVGATEVPKVEEDTVVSLDVDLPGLIKVTITTGQKIYVVYDDTKISFDDLEEALVLPPKSTIYIIKQNKEM